MTPRPPRSRTRYAPKILIVVFCLVGLVLGILAAIFIVRSITGPVAKTVQLAETMAGGDLTASWRWTNRMRSASWPRR
jgi:nitrogen fixation/metabolism regulation signal transduction histidine kinase